MNGIEIQYRMNQIQWLDEVETIDLLDNAEYLVSALQCRPGGEERMLLAHIVIGQAEDYRSYWGEDWVAPAENEAREPDFLMRMAIIAYIRA